MSSPHPPRLDVDALIADPTTKVIVTCGSGGVGKTTTAAAIGLRAAEAGRCVVVLTIDPARRLAQSLGLTELDNTPREVTNIDSAAGGRLLAMMLDMKRTFDDVVSAHSTPDRAEQIFANPFYQSLSTSFSGTQEYMAMEKLSQLRAAMEPGPDAADWDLIVVDTPPSRSALDFLDSPKRLGRFLDGRMIRLLAAPARAGGRAYLKVVTVGFSVFARILTKILGNDLLSDVASFVSSLEAMFGGFRERADQTYLLLKAPGTAFVVVASPEPDALREASFFVERLSSEEMPLAGLIINRMHRAPAELTVGEAQSGLRRLGEPADRDQSLAAAALRVHAEAATAAAADARMLRRFGAAHPTVEVIEVPALPSDVHDVEGLRTIGRLLGTNSPQTG